MHISLRAFLYSSTISLLSWRHVQLLCEWCSSSLIHELKSYRFQWWVQMRNTTVYYFVICHFCSIHLWQSTTHVIFGNRHTYMCVYIVCVLNTCLSVLLFCMSYGERNLNILYPPKCHLSRGRKKPPPLVWVVGWPRVPLCRRWWLAYLRNEKTNILRLSRLLLSGTNCNWELQSPIINQITYLRVLYIIYTHI